MKADSRRKKNDPVLDQFLYSLDPERDLKNATIRRRRLKKASRDFEIAANHWPAISELMKEAREERDLH